MAACLTKIHISEGSGHSPLLGLPCLQGSRLLVESLDESCDEHHPRKVQPVSHPKDRQYQTSGDRRPRNWRSGRRASMPSKSPQLGGFASMQRKKLRAGLRNRRKGVRLRALHSAGFREAPREAISSDVLQKPPRGLPLCSLQTVPVRALRCVNLSRCRLARARHLGGAPVV